LHLVSLQRGTGNQLVVLDELFNECLLYGKLPSIIYIQPNRQLVVFMSNQRCLSQIGFFYTTVWYNIMLYRVHLAMSKIRTHHVNGNAMIVHGHILIYM
jgi:hypothetical protein